MTKSAVERLADAWNATPDYTPTPYDQGRVDQRHEMTMQLLEAIEADRVAECEYGTRRSVTDGWEPGDRFGEHEYIDPRSVSDRPDVDRSTITGVRDPARTVRRRKAGPWTLVEGTEP